MAARYNVFLILCEGNKLKLDAYGIYYILCCTLSVIKQTHYIKLVQYITMQECW